MGKIFIADGAAGFILPYKDIVTWGIQVGVVPNIEPKYAANIQAFLQMKHMFRVVAKHVKVTPAEYRWSDDSEEMQASCLIILQRRSTPGQKLVPGRREERVKQFLQDMKYEGRMEWMVTGETDRFHCLGFD